MVCFELHNKKANHKTKRSRCPRHRRHDRARDYRLKRFELKTENRSRNNGSGQRFIASNGDSRHPTAEFRFKGNLRNDLFMKGESMDLV